MSKKIMNVVGKEQMNKEIQNRVEEMESRGYTYPRRFTAANYIIIGAAILISLAMIIGGYYI